MTRVIRQLFENRDGTAAVEAAIFAPFFLILTLGVADLGMGMYVRMAINGATQAGAAYAVIHPNASLSSIQAAMNDATGNPSFCATATCSASVATCADSAPKCITVSASYEYTPLLPDAVYSWAQSAMVEYTITIRVL
jgi:Flp pilus assembly protein TadG